MTAFQTILDSAKTMFRNAENSGAEDAVSIYSKAAILFEQAIELEPRNAEARYFLGYSYSRINSNDGRKMISVNRDLVIKSSEQFQRTIQLSPDYSGDIVIMDPYSKLTSEWGSLAISYQHKNKPDSVNYAFREGKLRGGFSNFMLEVNRCMLDACSKNAILFSSGDNISFPLWYLQKKENYRKDVSVVDINLLNTDWYRKFVGDQNSISFDLPPEALDTLDYQEWTSSEITIGKFTWLLTPTYEEQYLSSEDQIFLSLLRANKFNREVYFSMFFPVNLMLSLNAHLSPRIVADKVQLSQQKKLDFVAFKKSVKKYLALSKYMNKNSQDELRIFDGIRYNLLITIYEFYNNNEKKRARELLDILDVYADPIKFPFQDKELENYSIEIRQYL
jgi:hypothetical protein